MSPSRAAIAVHPEVQSEPVFAPRPDARHPLRPGSSAVTRPGRFAVRAGLAICARCSRPIDRPAAKPHRRCVQPPSIVIEESVAYLAERRWRFIFERGEDRLLFSGRERYDPPPKSAGGSSLLPNLRIDKPSQLQDQPVVDRNTAQQHRSFLARSVTPFRVVKPREDEGEAGRGRPLPARSRLTQAVSGACLRSRDVGPLPRLAQRSPVEQCQRDGHDEQ